MKIHIIKYARSIFMHIYFVLCVFHFYIDIDRY